MGTKLFTIDQARGTKQYAFTMLSEKADENIAKSMLVDMAKSEGNVEWCFLEPRKALDDEFREITCYQMLANPFYSKQAA